MLRTRSQPHIYLRHDLEGMQLLPLQKKNKMAPLSVASATTLIETLEDGTKIYEGKTDDEWSVYG